MKFAVIPNLQKNKAISYADTVCIELLNYGSEIFMLSECKNHIESTKVTFFDSKEDLIKNCDIVIALGGDGTIIHVARYCALYGKPILGINFGRLGFIAGLEPDDIHSLKRLVTGDYTIDRRSVLQIEAKENGENHTYYAINDVVISRGSCSRIIDLDVFLNDTKISSYRADGLIFSTPTGSTAYGLSAGGPVIDPHISCICMVPVCPHTLFSRPVIFNDNSVLSVSCTEHEDNEVYVTIDGHKNIELFDNDKVIIKSAPIYADLIKLNDKDFYCNLNDKLWQR